MSDLDMCVEVGESTSFSKTITDFDVGMFSAISGDFDPVHVNDEYARGTFFGKRIAHGIGVMALLSAAESEMSRTSVSRGTKGKPVSVGYEGVRFLKPVFIGDTLTATYSIAELQPEKMKAIAKCEISNQKGDLVLVGQHIMKWV